MPTMSRTAVAADYQKDAEQERSIALGFDAVGNKEQAEIHHAAAEYFAEKAAYAGAKDGSPPIVLGEVTSDDASVIAWTPKNTLRDPEQVALDASAARKAVLLEPDLEVCAMALDAADSIEATNSLEKMLAHQLALAHKLTFAFATRAVREADPATAQKLMNVSIKLMNTFQAGLVTVRKLRSGHSQIVTVQHVNVHGGQTMVAGSMQTGGSRRNPRERKET